MKSNKLKFSGLAGALLVGLLSAQAHAVKPGYLVDQSTDAVTRNTVRRRLKAVCAEALPRLRPGSDIVIRALPTSATADFASLRTEVARYGG